MYEHIIFLILIYAFIIGACIGSFLNVVIYRTPKQMDIEERNYAREILEIDEEHEQMDNIFRSSACPKCGNKLKWWHNFPIFGWLLLRGKCYFCKDKISIQYPLIEFITAIVFTLIIYNCGLTYKAFSLIILTVFFIPLFMIDAKKQILPDSMTLPLVWIGLIINSFGIFVDLQSAVYGAIIGYLSLWSVYWLFKILTGKEGFGFGDFKLLAGIGAFFGYKPLLFIIFASSIIGILTAIVITVVKRSKTSVIAFGPSIILATVLFLCTQQNLYLWYNNYMYF